MTGSSARGPGATGQRSLIREKMEAARRGRPRSGAPPPIGSDQVTYAQLRTAARFDPAVFRAFWKIMGMLCQPREVYTDPQVVAGAREVLQRHGTGLAMAQPDRAQLLAALNGRQQPPGS